MRMQGGPGLIEDTSISTRGSLGFFLAAVLGMTFIVFAKLTALNQAEITAIPVLVLLVYAFILFRWRRLTLRDDQSGDNLYYLGFLFTLTSIAVSLYQFSLNEGAQEQIVTNFGIAIATTIVGLALRVMFNQMRQDPAEVERVARLELSEAARRLRLEIDSVVVELNVFQRTIQQSLVDSQKTIQERIDRSLKASSDSLVDISNLARTELGEGIPDLAKQVSSLTESAVLAGRAMNGLRKRIGNLKTPELLVELNLAPTIAKAETLMDQALHAQADHAERLEGVVRSVEAAAATMRESAEAIANTQNIRRSDGSQGLVTRAFNRITGRVPQTPAVRNGKIR